MTEAKAIFESECGSTAGGLVELKAPAEGKLDVSVKFKFWFRKVDVCNIKATINSCWARNSSAWRSVQRGILLKDMMNINN